MAKLLLLSLLVILSVALTSNAATYMVGDNSGWDISSNLDTWPVDKAFKVGDVLVFMYSSSETVSEVSKENYDKCNANNVLKRYSNGNTTITLSRPGDWFFISANRLYCLGGMKLQVHVEDDQAASSPIGSPEAQPGATSSLPNPVQPSSKSNKPSATVPTSSAEFSYGRTYSYVIAFLGFMASLSWMVQV